MYITDLDHLPEEVDDMRFAILDNVKPTRSGLSFYSLDLFGKFQCTWPWYYALERTP